jgi:23S rRNA C2498 (ribose-2'-O)-methylase RlmM
MYCFLTLTTLRIGPTFWIGPWRTYFPYQKCELWVSCLQSRREKLLIEFCRKLLLNSLRIRIRSSSEMKKQIILNKYFKVKIKFAGISAGFVRETCSNRHRKCDGWVIFKNFFLLIPRSVISTANSTQNCTYRPDHFVVWIFIHIQFSR